jgi:uncharacterized iron-regulated protein
MGVVVELKAQIMSNCMLIHNYKLALAQVQIESAKHYHEQNVVLLEQFEDHADNLLDEIIERNLFNFV